MANNTTFIGPLDAFKECYLRQICPYLNFPICIIGSALNVLNIMVFSSKPLSSSMNMIFLHLTIAELAALLVNIPLTWHTCLDHKAVHQHVYNWEIFHFYARCSISVLFYLSVWLTVMLTIWRYLAVAYPFQERHWCNVKNTRMMMIAGYVFAILLSLPSFFSLNVQYNDANNNYTIEFDETSLLYYIHFITNGTVLKLVPSLVLTIFSYKLIRTLFDANDRRVKLSQNNGDVEQNKSDKQKTDVATRMLLGVLLAFLISEVPSGILGLLSIIRGPNFRKSYFSPMIHVFTTIRLFSISISFFVYYNSSQQFRKTFKSMLNRKKQHITNSRESRSGNNNSDTSL